MKKTNYPTQGQPNPKQIKLKNGIRATFPAANNFSWVELWFNTGNRLQETEPNQIFRNVCEAIYIVNCPICVKML